MGRERKRDRERERERERERDRQTDRQIESSCHCVTLYDNWRRRTSMTRRDPCPRSDFGRERERGPERDRERDREREREERYIDKQ